MKATLYTIPGSHPCAAVEVALKLKGITYKRVDLLPLAPLVAGPLRWGGSTVPGMRIDGERIIGSRTIMRRLDELVSEPPLLPGDDAGARERVLEAERWGDEVLQSVPRRIIDAGFLRNPYAMGSYAEGAKLPIPPRLMRPAMPLTARLMARRNDAQDGPVRKDLDELPSTLDRIDAWIAEGVLGGEAPNAADLQIGSSVRLLSTIGDLRPLLEQHPAARLTSYFPAPAGEIPPGTLPAEWLTRAHA